MLFKKLGGNMNGTATKKIRALCASKDRNMINTLIRVCGEKPFDQKSPVAIYRTAKKYYREFAKKDKWGQFKLTLHGNSV